MSSCEPYPATPSTRELVRAQRALTIVQFILEIEVLKAEAKLYQPWRFSNVIGPRQSVLNISDAIVMGEVNETIGAIGGIPTRLSDGHFHHDTPVSLVRWFGPNPQAPDQHAWGGMLNGMPQTMTMSISKLREDLVGTLSQLEQADLSAPRYF